MSDFPQHQLFPNLFGRSFPPAVDGSVVGAGGGADGLLLATMLTVLRPILSHREPGSLLFNAAAANSR